ncbi:MAG: hypothetical protein K1X83_14110 [Oligoflexia bacterium]|nr:hypothetical protein [Oligoflexia bacterium]
MQGVLANKNVIYRLEVAGADYCQGDQLCCALTVENVAVDPVVINTPCLRLVVADLKKVKNRDPAAYAEEIASAACPAEITLAGKEKSRVAWDLTLDRNCVISDKHQTLCFVYGSDASTESLGQLPAVVSPHKQIQGIAAIFESPFQFVPKGQRSNDGWVELKFKPPASKQLALVEELLAQLRFSAEALQMRYLFKVKTFDATETAVKVGKTKSMVEQSLEPRQYMLTSDHLNHDYLESQIGAALKTVSTSMT